MYVKSFTWFFIVFFFHPKIFLSNHSSSLFDERQCWWWPAHHHQQSTRWDYLWSLAFLHRLLQTQSSWLVWPHDSSDDNILSASLKVQLSPSLEDDKRKCKILYWNTRRIFYSNYDWISLLDKFQNFWKLKNIFQFWTC